MKKKTIVLFVLLFLAFLGFQTGTSAAESHVEGHDARGADQGRASQPVGPCGPRPSTARVRGRLRAPGGCL